jgi:hypothetical protein
MQETSQATHKLQLCLFNRLKHLHCAAGSTSSGLEALAVAVFHLRCTNSSIMQAACIQQQQQHLLAREPHARLQPLIRTTAARLQPPSLRCSRFRCHGAKQQKEAAQTTSESKQQAPVSLNAAQGSIRPQQKQVGVCVSRLGRPACTRPASPAETLW